MSEVKVKILVVAYEMPPQHSGAGIDIQRTYQALVSMYPNIQVKILSLKGEKCDSDISEKIVIQRILNRWNTSSLLKMSFNFFQILKNLFRSNIVHLNALYPIGLVIIPIANFFNKKTILQLHCMGVDDPDSVLLRKHGRLLYFFYQKAKFFKTYSKAQTDALLNNGISLNRILEVPPYIEDTEFFPVTDEIRTEIKQSLGIRKEAIVMTSIGRIGLRKGSDIVLDVFNILNDKVLDIELLMVGPFEKNITQDFPQTLKFKIDNISNKRIHFLGERQDIRNILQITDYFILPSKGEGFGIVNIEALACGAIVLLSNLKGVFDTIIDNKKDGIIVNSFNSQDYAKEILSIIKDQERKQSIRNHGFKKVREKYSKGYTLRPFIKFIFDKKL